MVQELGGVIGHPEIYSLYYGKDASRQVLNALGIDQRVPDGGVAHDGLTHVCIHTVPSNLYEDCQTLLAGENPLARMFSNGSQDPVRTSRFHIEQVLQAPWETLPLTLTSNSGRLREVLEAQSGVLSDYFNFNDPEFVNRLRMLENSHLQGVI